MGPRAGGGKRGLKCKAEEDVQGLSYHDKQYSNAILKENANIQVKPGSIQGRAQP